MDKGLQSAINMFDQSNRQNKSIILITDGEATNKTAAEEGGKYFGR